MAQERQMAAALEGLLKAIGPTTHGPPPVERWNPPFCGDIGMRIAADGSWHYNGSPIARPAMVKLFASVLKREEDRFFLVTPVEKLGIEVEDAPFHAVEMAVDGEGDGRTLNFRTNVDDLAIAGPEGALRFETGAKDGVIPYVHVRRGLWARLTRPLALDLLALAETRAAEDGAWVGVAAGGAFHRISRANDGETPA